MAILLPNRASQILRRERLEKVVKAAKRAAQRGPYYYGKEPPSALGKFRHTFTVDGIGVLIIYTRDVGHHTGGWFKNPDYERCLHLSASYRSPDGATYLPQNHALSRELAELFFGDYTRWLWIEPPFGPEGKRGDIYHYRLFCDPSWTPLFPRGEVYSKEFTEKGWKSFSEIHGRKPDMVQQA